MSEDFCMDIDRDCTYTKSLRQRVAELEKERDELKLVVSAHADFFSSTQSEMADLKESVECLSATNDFLIGKRDENIILKAAVKQLTAERDALKQQRDELLAAIDYAIKQVPELGTVPGIAAAIASVNEK